MPGRQQDLEAQTEYIRAHKDLLWEMRCLFPTKKQLEDVCELG